MVTYKAKHSIIRKFFVLFIPKIRMENFSAFYITRIVYKKLMALNGINNITLILINDRYTEEEFADDPEIMTFKSLDELENFSCTERLTNILKYNYFAKGAVLFSVVKEKKIIASTWLHYNFDPDGDIDLIGVNNYLLYGPTFVDINYRNLGLSTRLKKHACYYVNKNWCYPIYLGNEVDNIPTIKSSIKAGFRLRNIIIRTKNGEPIIL